MSKLKNPNAFHQTSITNGKDLLVNSDINTTTANLDEKRRNFAVSRIRNDQLLNENDNDKTIETINSIPIYSSAFSMMNDYCEENNNNLEYRNSNSMNKYCGSTVYQVDIAENSEQEIALNDEMLENTARLERAEVGFKNNESVDVDGDDDDNNNDDDAVYEAEATIGTNSIEDASHSSTSSSASTFSSNVAIITETSQQQLNLKPILKRKDSIETKNQIVQNNSVLPPILKKRDSINDNVVSSLQFSSNTFNSSKPLSILKNRQTKGSYSLDDNIGLDLVLPTDDCSTVSSSSTTTTTTIAAHQLKPILKKKSWSTDEKVPTGVVTTANETVKGILKSSDKSTSSSTISSKNSILDETVSYINTNTTTNNNNNQLKSPTHINRTTLKSILKSSLKNRSTSLSPCTSTDSLVDDIDSTDRYTSTNFNKSAFLKRTSLDNDRMSIKLLENYSKANKSFLSTQSSQPQPGTTDDSQFSVINLNIKPILKRNSLDSHGEVDTSFIRNIQLATTEIPIEQNSTEEESSDCAPVTTINNKLQYFNMSTSSSSAVNNNNNNNDKTMTNKTTVANDHDDDTINEDSRMSTSSNVTLRPGNNEPSLGRARPKSCILSTSNEARELNQSSIKDRLALLKQNGEQAWKSRVQKNDDRSNNGTNAIGNRLSSLLESQSQWRNRVPENDAKQFSVASKISQIQSNDNDKVTLRETPKRHGLRGSTLSEKKLGAISSKLNSVLLGEKNPYSSIKAKKQEQNQILSDYDSKSYLSSTETPKTTTTTINKSGKQPETIEILKPDDEESFGSFFGIDNSTLEQIINQNSAKQFSRLDSIENASTSIKLLENKKIRVQAPKRRAATKKNPMKLLDEVPITVDSYQSCQSSINNNESLISNTKHVLNDSKMAISALAGLASTEDFKSVANKLRNNGCTRNDSWRTFDLKNSLQSKMLILVKGRRKAHIRLIEPNWNSLNQTDSFILVTKERIYAYVGQYSNIIERTKCLEISELIRKRKDLCYRSSTNEITLIDCHDNSKRFITLFDQLLPLLKELNFTEEKDRKMFDEKFSKPITDVDLDEDDELYEELITYSNLVYMVNFDEKTDNVQLKLMESYSGRSPRHIILQQDVALVFDYGSEMYVWLGKCVSNLLRKKAVEAAKCLWLNGYDYTEFEMNPIGEKSPLKCDKRPDWSWFIRVNHNMEPILFKDKFFNWPAFTLIRSEKKPRKENLVPEKKMHKIVKKDLSAELNLFPVDVENDMINKQPKEQELILEFVSLGRGSGDTIKDEDGLPVKVVSLNMQCFYIDEAGDRVELNETDRNFLCSGESYYIRWKYRLTRISRNLKTGGESRFSEHHGGRDRLCYFVWQGKNAKNTKRGLTALNAIEKLREEGACQTYIEHGNEDPVFLRIFQGSLLIQLGKRKQIAENKRYRMFLLNDTMPEEEFMVEMECSFKNLRSRMSYVFINPDNAKEVFIWNGIKTSENKRKSIRKFVETNILNKRSKEFGFLKNDLNYQIVEIEEGSESKNFMAIFYSSNPASPDSTLRRSSKSNLQRDIYYSLMDDLRSFNFTPRLFHFVTSSEQIFEAIEIVPAYLPPKTSKTIVNYPFTQDDLYGRAKSRPTFFLIDAEYEVFLWESKYPFFIYNNTNNNQKDDEKQNIPRMIDIENEIQSECNTTTGFMSQLWLAERKCALETTLAYCHAKNSTEPPKSYVISAGLEPDVFCGLFPTWNYYDNVAKLHIQDGRKPGEQILVQEVLSQIEDVNQSTYSYEELKRRPVPEGINILCLESYLDDEEFEKVFLMNREEFYSLPTWKQKIIKQEKELF